MRNNEPILEFGPQLPSDYVDQTIIDEIADIVDSELSIQEKEAPTLPAFSYYEYPITNPKPNYAINIKDLHRIVISDDFKLVTEQLQNIEDGKEQKTFKRTKLNSITPSGIFSTRGNNNITNHSGLICIDIDDLPKHQVQVIKEVLIADKTLQPVMIFTSPRGCGLKVFYRIPATAKTHLNYFVAIENYLKTERNIVIDKACKDVARACFLSHDPNAYHQPFYEVDELNQSFLDKWLVTEIKKIPAAAPIPFPTISTNNENSDVSQLDKLLTVINSKRIDITSKHSNWLKIVFALSNLGEQGRTYFHQISQYHPEYDSEKCNDLFDDTATRNDGRTKLATIFHIAKDYGVLVKESPTPDKLVKEKKAKQALTLKPRTLRTASQRMTDGKKLPDAKPLVGSLWQEGELDILFADTGVGKSVWATQIANAISKGESALPELPNDCEPKKVLYYDFELSDKQFQMRYTDEAGNLFQFNDNLILDNLNVQELLSEHPSISLDLLIVEQIKADIQALKPQAVVIDNITYLANESTQDAATALNLIKALKAITKEYNLSMLVLAHTPKIKEGIMLSLNELAGSKNLSNFADSVSAIGKCTSDPTKRYIKQIKTRSTEQVYHANNVIIANMGPFEGFLSLKFESFGEEKDLIRVAGGYNLQRDERYDEVIDLHNQGKTCRNIEKLLGVPKSTASKWINDNNVSEENDGDGLPF
jgi:hypothetical protein